MVLIQKILRATFQNSKHVLKQIRHPARSSQFISSLRYYSSSQETSDAVTGRFFSDKHEWITVQGNIGTIGISDYAQEALGDVVFAQLPDVGTSYKADEEVGALESVKAASEIYTPVSGDVCEKNTIVEDKPSLINTSCYDKGWLFKIKLTKPIELADLMSEEDYLDHLKKKY